MLGIEFQVGRAVERPLLCLPEAVRVGGRGIGRLRISGQLFPRDGSLTVRGHLKRPRRGVAGTDRVSAAAGTSGALPQQEVERRAVECLGILVQPGV